MIAHTRRSFPSGTERCARGEILRENEEKEMSQKGTQCLAVLKFLRVYIVPESSFFGGYKVHLVLC